MDVQRERTAGPVGRPRRFNEDIALDKAMHVFWRKGFEGASIIDLTKAMNIKPASLYSTFGNKQDLFRKAFDLYRAKHLPFLAEALQEPTAHAVAERLLCESAIFLTQQKLPHICLTIQTVAASDKGAVIHKDLIKFRNDAQNSLRKRFERSRREGDLPKTSNPGSLARFLTAVCQGMNIQAVNGATRKDLLDLARTSLLGWPKK